uniref:NAD-dependent protein deacetylase n=1 Tax=Rhabditophanes sp. KR3021 TaxID=114890 RepID=A0AC35TG04_9BILA
MNASEDVTMVDESVVIRIDSSADPTAMAEDEMVPKYYSNLLQEVLEASDEEEDEEEEEQPQPIQKLPSLTLEGVAKFITETNPKNICFMVGAGISTSAGIPDFRSPGTGLYDNLEKYNLDDPQDIFDIDFFEENPEPFFTLAKELFPEGLKPTLCHYFIKLVEKKGLLKRCFTQNIDSLEYIAGISEEKVVAAHGSHNTSTCRGCGKKFDLDWITGHLNSKSLVPHCDEDLCDGVVKPDIIFFGESLPRRFFLSAIEDAPVCDLLIIMGTSLVVQPFAQLAHEVSDDVPRLLINMTSAGKRKRDMSEKALKYGEEGNIRDVFWQGTCDNGALELATLLGWKDDLNELISTEHERLEHLHGLKKAAALTKSSP